MSTKRDKIKEEIADLVFSGDCTITQIIGDSAEEAYEGCERNIFMAMEDEYTSIDKTPATDSQPCTYKISYETYMGVCQIIIKELE